MEEEIFRPEFHPHNLKQKINNENYRCDGCRSFGFGLRFRCEQCNFNLHEECGHVKRTIGHDFFKYNIFKFFPEPPDPSVECAGCGGLVEGFVYYCEELKKCLHPCCHRLPSKFKFYHLEFRLRHRVSSSMCILCRRGSGILIEGMSYVSKCNKYNFHVKCATRQYEKGVHLGNSLEQSIQALLEITIGAILKRQKRRKIVMSFVITNLVLELVSALLDQVSSRMNKTRCALFGMLISFAAMLTCILELIYEGRTEKLIWRQRDTLPFPWYYYHTYQRRKPFGTFKDIVGLICALCQCVVATVSYCFLRRNDDNPIKMSFFPIVFAFGILISQILKNEVTEKPSRKNEENENEDDEKWSLQV